MKFKTFSQELAPSVIYSAIRPCWLIFV